MKIRVVLPESTYNHFNDLNHKICDFLAKDLIADAAPEALKIVENLQECVKLFEKLNKNQLGLADEN